MRDADSIIRDADSDSILHAVQTKLTHNDMRKELKKVTHRNFIRHCKSVDRNIKKLLDKQQINNPDVRKRVAASLRKQGINEYHAPFVQPTFADAAMILNTGVANV